MFVHNAPVTFQRQMQKVLAELESFCSVYKDDILVVVFSELEEEHVNHLNQIFRRLCSLTPPSEV